MYKSFRWSIYRVAMSEFFGILKAHSSVLRDILDPGIEVFPVDLPGEILRKSPRLEPLQESGSRESENDQCGPDQTEADEMGCRERLLKDKNSQKKRNGRREILEKSDHRKRYSPRPLRKPHQRNSRDNTCSQKKQMSGDRSPHNRSCLLKKEIQYK